MFKTLTKDRENIERKYHDPSKPFNPFLRWTYHGYEYDETTGLSDAEIEAGAQALAKTMVNEPHPIQKAKTFAFVLDNTRIDVNERDYFIGIYTWNPWLVSKRTLGDWSEEVYAAFPEEMEIKKLYTKSGSGSTGLDFSHTVPDWDSIMQLGFPGLLERAKACYAKIENPTPKQTAFFEAVKIEYESILRLLDRLYQYAKGKDFEKAPRIAACLQNLRDGAPQNTFDALQLIYIYFMLSEGPGQYQVRSLGHGLDSTLYPFFKKDIENGTFTEEEIAEFIGYFLMQWTAIGNYWGQPMYLGGRNVDGTTKVNKLSYIILDVYDKLGIYNPKIQIKYSPSTPRDFILKALEMIRHGISSIVFCNDEVITKALMARVATYEEAVENVISGCYEYKTKGTVGISGTTINLLNAVPYVFDNGFDTVANEQIGLQTGTLKTLDTFEKFYQAYLCQLENITCTLLNVIHKLETRIAEINPAILYSTTCESCMEKMQDALDCGVKFNTTNVTVNGLGTAVDALMAVKTLCYDEKTVTLSEMKDALDKNWEGYETLRAKALACPHKYGNGDAEADAYAAAIVQFVYGLLAGRKNSHGGPHTLEVHSARYFIDLGEFTKATPDGRMAGQETSKNSSPTPGADRKGITALIQSATQIDTAICTDGFCLDVMLHPTSVQGKDGLGAFYAVLETYMQKGGASIQFNIFDAELLRDAQEHPEKYQTLQVRVCGWNVLWNNMSRTEQDAYILRMENVK